MGCFLCLRQVVVFVVYFSVLVIHSLNYVLRLYCSV